ncbi:peptide chain release factor 1 [Dehalococcoidia bacterium]|nr:peptide chain release factor 1 [Dehalococcoidia bacterium]
MVEKLEAVDRRFQEVTSLLEQPEIATDYTRIQELAKERAMLERLVALYRDYRKTSQELEEIRGLIAGGTDEELETLARQEAVELEERLTTLVQSIRLGLIPSHPFDEKSVIVEIRAGAGGDEAGLFAADLYRMYSRYASLRGWKVDVIDSNATGIGAFREITFELNGKGAYSALKHESGVHRVQRVPTTEAGGRIHTSTATVAVMPEADDVEVNVADEDLRIDIFHSGGHGGQNVQKVATAVRIVHKPTGITAVCQDERSQLKNKLKAMAVLRARLLDMEQRKRQEEITENRRAQVGTGDRSEKVRTYNFPQDRVTDHRLETNFHNLPELLQGKIEGIVEALAAREQAERLAASIS